MSIRSFVPWLLLVVGGCAHGDVTLRLQTRGPDGGLVDMALDCKLHQKDPFALVVTSQWSAYLYAVRGTKNALEALSPLGDKGIRIQADQQTHLPSSAGWFEAGGQAGKEVLYLVASTGPLELPQIQQAVAAARDTGAAGVNRGDIQCGPQVKGDTVTDVIGKQRPAVMRFSYRICGPGANCPQPSQPSAK